VRARRLLGAVPAFPGRVPRSTILVVLALLACGGEAKTTSDGCDPTLEVPEGFCAEVVADSLGPLRHVAVRANGDLVVARLSARRDSGGVLILRGKPGERMQVVGSLGNRSMHGVVLADDSTLYASTDHEVVRYRFTGTDFKPAKRVDTIVTGLPSRGKPSHSLALDVRGRLIVNVGALSNACQATDAPNSPGKSPCPELETSAGLWSYSASELMQAFESGSRIASGLHNAVALTANAADSMVYAVSHGRDKLHENWPSVIDELAGATRAGEEMVRVASMRADFGWPYCYYDVVATARVVAPEYATDADAPGRCERAIQPLTAFPAHWSPMAMTFYTGDKFPAKYKQGVFVAFHGSAHRGPLPQDGYAILFVPFKETLPRVDHERFADGFAGEIKSPDGARHRPSGIAQGKDGALYVTDDAGGRVWRIRYR
jgi:glucose/arabinose dehydrogenase